MTNTYLEINPHIIALYINDKMHNIPLSLTQIERQLGAYPPSEYAWENAIYQVEEAIMPLTAVIQSIKTLTIDYFEDFLDLSDDEYTIDLATLEHAFDVTAGLARDVSLNLAYSVELCVVLLVLRECMHHWGVDLLQMKM
ncbi:hypothetical protein ACKLNO_05945 [Neisseriaceae bacterium B1]